MRPVLRLGSPRKPRFKECPICRDQFEVRRLAQKTCADFACAITFGKQMAEAKRVKEVRKERREYRVRNKTISQLKKEADKEFGRYIRERDYYLPCVSCDETNPMMTSGGQWDCGHFRSKGAADHLRYNEDNAAKQCKACNGGAGNFEAKRETVHREYRKRLIARIGLERVEALENDNSTIHWTREGLMALRRKYVGMWKELKARREA